MAQTVQVLQVVQISTKPTLNLLNSTHKSLGTLAGITQITGQFLPGLLENIFQLTTNLQPIYRAQNSNPLNDLNPSQFSSIEAKKAFSAQNNLGFIPKSGYPIPL